MEKQPQVFVEPFAGGGIVGLTVAFESLANQVLMRELDEQVAAVWQTVLGGGGKWLAETILNFDLTRENVRATLQEEFSELHQRAFQTILKNRVYHGGILAAGSGLIKYGENGKGLKSRWYPETLARRILDIDRMKHKIEFSNGDGFDLLNTYSNDENCVFFIDPPYTATGKRAGRRLYKHNEVDHSALFGVAERLRGDFLMTYDKAQGAIDLAETHGFDTLAIPMKNTHHAEMFELLIGRNLDWARSLAL